MPLPSFQVGKLLRTLFQPGRGASTLAEPEPAEHVVAGMVPAHGAGSSEEAYRRDETARRLLENSPHLRRLIEDRDRRPGELFADLAAAVSILPQPEKSQLLPELRGGQSKIRTLKVDGAAVPPAKEQGQETRYLTALEAKIVQAWHTRSDLLIALIKEGERAIATARSVMADPDATGAQVYKAVVRAQVIGQLAGEESKAVRERTEAHISETIRRGFKGGIKLPQETMLHVKRSLLEQTQGHRAHDQFAKKLSSLETEYTAYRGQSRPVHEIRHEMPHIEVSNEYGMRMSR